MGNGASFFLLVEDTTTDEIPFFFFSSSLCFLKQPSCYQDVVYRTHCIVSCLQKLAISASFRPTHSTSACGHCTLLPGTANEL